MYWLSLYIACSRSDSEMAAYVGAWDPGIGVRRDSAKIVERRDALTGRSIRTWNCRWVVGTLTLRALDSSLVTNGSD